MDGETPRQRYRKRLGRLKSERSSWDAHWKELSDYMLPRSSRFFASDTNRGGRVNSNIINGTATWALDVQSAGMMAGISSPAKPWFRLATPDPSLNEFGAVKEWLYLVEDRIRQAFALSNVYNCLHSTYRQLGTFGTACFHLDEDDDTLLRGYVWPIGQWCLANNPKLRVDTVYRELSMTVGQLVEAFGLDKCGDQTKAKHQRGAIDDWVPVLHVVEPNKGRVYGQAGPKGMPFKSCWYELTADEPGSPLKESGYEEFPVLCPRWDANGEDVYGSSPGMDALGDTKGLQLLEKRKLLAAEKIVDPPMRGPSSMAQQRASLVPGKLTLVDSLHPGQSYQPSHEVPPLAIDVMERSIREHELRIKRAFKADLWLMLAESDRRQITATEIAERHEEKLLQLGPVMERLAGELYDPLIGRSFGTLWRLGYIPPPPPELAGIQLRVNYISIVAQAMKMLGIATIDRLVGFGASIAAVNLEVMDKIDLDQAVDEYGSALGVPPKLVRTDEQVARIRSQRAQQQAAMAKAETAVQSAQAAKTLSETDTSGENALTDMMGAIAPMSRVGGKR